MNITDNNNIDLENRVSRYFSGDNSFEEISLYYRKTWRRLKRDQKRNSESDGQNSKRVDDRTFRMILSCKLWLNNIYEYRFRFLCGWSDQYVCCEWGQRRYQNRVDKTWNRQTWYCRISSLNVCIWCDKHMKWRLCNHVAVLTGSVCALTDFQISSRCDEHMRSDIERERTLSDNDKKTTQWNIGGLRYRGMTDRDCILWLNEFSNG
jgi:hypothetical protein